MQTYKFLRHCFLKIIALIQRATTTIQHPKLAFSPDIFLKYPSPQQLNLNQNTNYIRTDFITSKSKILIIIPFKDKWDLTEKCLGSILENEKDNSNLSIALVDNNSTDAATKDGLEKFINSNPQQEFHFIEDKSSFNFSRINNNACEKLANLDFDYYLFLNNDIELLEKSSINQMSLFLDNNQKAASIGCTLLFPNRTIQHSFLFTGNKIVGAHPCKNFKLNETDAWYQAARPVGAITGACMMVRKSKFHEVSGFDENLATCYQDVDLCIKLRESGGSIWVLPWIKMIHHETQTRKAQTNWDEVEYINKKWGEKLTMDPFVHSKFSRWSESPAFNIFYNSSYPWYWLSEKSKS